MTAVAPAQTDPTQTRRSRLTPEREAELYSAILALLQEEGYENLTMDAIATRTRSSKATLYRQWGSKPHLIAATLRHYKALGAVDIDTGSLRGDLRAMAQRIVRKGKEQVGVFWSLADSIRRDPELATAVRAAIVEPESAALQRLVQRAVDRGEIGTQCAGSDFMQCMMVGAVMTRSMTHGQEPDEEYLFRFIDAVMLPSLGVAAETQPHND